MGKKSRRRGARGIAAASSVSSVASATAPPGYSSNGIANGHPAATSSGSRTITTAADEPTLSSTLTKQCVSVASLPSTLRSVVRIHPKAAEDGANGAAQLALRGVDCTNYYPNRCNNCMKFLSGQVEKLACGARYEFRDSICHLACGEKLCHDCFDNHESTCVASPDFLGLLELRHSAGVPWATHGLFLLEMQDIYIKWCARRRVGAVPIDIFNLLKKAADCGHPLAQATLASWCTWGGPVRRDLNVARKYADLAVAAGVDYTLHYFIAMLYYRIEGNIPEALSSLSRVEPWAALILAANSLSAGVVGANSVQAVREAILLRRAFAMDKTSFHERLRGNADVLVGSGELTKELSKAFVSDSLNLSTDIYDASKKRLEFLQGPSRSVLENANSYDRHEYLTSTGGGFCDCCGISPVEAGLLSLLKCSRCRRAFYCNSDCQSRAWKSGHKECCKKYGAVTVGDQYVTQCLVDGARHLNEQIVRIGGLDESGGWFAAWPDNSTRIIRTKNLRSLRPLK